MFANQAADPLTKREELTYTLPTQSCETLMNLGVMGEDEVVLLSLGDGKIDAGKH